MAYCGLLLLVALASLTVVRADDEACKHGTLTANYDELSCACDDGYSGADCSKDDSSDSSGCSVHLRAVGLSDSDIDKSNMAQISLNGESVFESDYPDNNKRGFNIVILDKDSCTSSDYTTYDTHGSGDDARKLATYLKKQPKGTIILGVTSDSANLNLGPAKAALKSIGVIVDDLGDRGKVAFIVDKGNKTIRKNAKAGTDHIEIDHEF